MSCDVADQLSANQQFKKVSGFETMLRFIGCRKKLDGLLHSTDVIEAPGWKPNIDHHQETAVLPRNQLLHWGPVLALSITFYIGSVSSFFAVMWWPVDSLGGFLNLTLFFFWNYCTVVNLVRASFTGPGRVPLEWRPNDDECNLWDVPVDYLLQWCEPCRGYKVPRAHHCSHCGRCSMKMDHHCPWINNCVGHRNHAFFVRFLVSAIIGCLHALLILMSSFYHAINLNYYHRFGGDSKPEVILTFWSLILLVIASAFAFGVVVGVGGLLYLQLKYIKNNKTGIEEYIEQKAISYRQEEDCNWGDFTFPYDLGWKRNFQEVLFSWSGQTTGNGVWWPVRKGCDQFSLSREQLRQKALKRYFSRLVIVEKDFHGGYIASIFFGCRMFICQPFSGEPRLKISKGDEYVITRGQRGWVYGYKRDDDKYKGWFPRSCVRFTDNYPFQKQAEESSSVSDSTSKS